MWSRRANLYNKSLEEFFLFIFYYSGKVVLIRNHCYLLFVEVSVDLDKTNFVIYFDFSIKNRGGGNKICLDMGFNS